jgi:hypothetical protein
MQVAFIGRTSSQITPFSRNSLYLADSEADSFFLNS